MIRRLVKLNIDAKQVEAFKDLFEAHKSQIRAFEGCEHLELWQDKTSASTFFTYSHWTDETRLEAYRQSELFGNIWPQTKLMFAGPAEAWSSTCLTEVTAL